MYPERKVLKIEREKEINNRYKGKINTKKVIAFEQEGLEGEVNKLFIRYENYHPQIFLAVKDGIKKRYYKKFKMLFTRFVIQIGT